MAVDVAAPTADRSSSLTFARLAAVPARVTLGAIVGLSFAVRFVAALAHATPLYFPDEYIYGALARSLATSGGLAIRGTPAHFPALLEPLLAAPFWLTGSPELAYRLTQGLNALAMSLAAVPVYLLARRLRLSQGFALGSAALAVAFPDLLYASFVMADPIAYPLVLGAVYAAVCALEARSRRSQIAFVALAGLATFARVQYVVVPAAFVVAAIALERRRFLRVHALPFALLAAPVVAAAALGPSRILGYYSGIAHLKVGAGSIAHWAATDAMMLAYSAGWILVPGALAGIGLALARPRSRAERAFGALVVALGAGLFVEAALYASSGSTRYQERYLFTLLPLVAPAFGLYVSRGWPRRLVLALVAAAMVALSARIPLSGFTAADNKQDSPFLFAVFRLESLMGTANGALAVAVVAACLSVAALAVARRRHGATVALALSIACAGTASAGAFSFDSRNAANVRESHLPRDLRWIDRSGLRDVTLVQTPGAPRGRALEQLFWNRAVTRVALLRGAYPTDAFGADPITIARDGRLVAGGSALRGPLLVENYGVRAVLAGAVRAGRGSSLELWRPTATPRLSLLASGLYADGWLARTGSVTVWPDETGWTRGTLTLTLSLPSGTQRTPLHFRAGEADRRVVIRPGERRAVVFRFAQRGPWRLVYRTPVRGFLSDGRAISVRAEQPVLHRAR
ncbi:MAG TPA: glycosyltransferase family 39 protein [Gaiellaceae bacterium]